MVALKDFERGVVVLADKKGKINVGIMFIALALFILLSACAPMSAPTGGQVPPEYTAKEGRVSSLEIALADAMIEIEKMKARAVSSGDELPAIPPDAETGRCYARMLLPPAYVDRVEKRVVKEAAERLETVPATFAAFDEQVLVSEEHVRLTLVPATYKWLEEHTEVLPARSEQVLVKAAEYKTVMEEVIASPEELVWQAGRGEIEKIDEESGEIVHQRRIPAKYKKISKQVLVAPAQYRKEVTPAVYETLRKRVVDVPEHTIQEMVPARYKTVSVQREVAPAKEVRHVIAPVYKSFSYREKVADARLDWRMIPCEREVSKDLVYRIQRALRAKAYDTGGVDGVLGKYTLAAIHDYQKSQGLATGRLSIEVIQALGVSLLAER
ncbi:peptidoglycan-binding protein [Zhongshania sp.]|uniref:peptidoglycan-binding domain-containing protein n=1 Tax=Zhongshania sp. TaxID=1971902 RepID=UPI003563A21F